MVVSLTFLEVFLAVMTYVVWFLATFFLIFFVLVLFANKETLLKRKKLDPSYRPLVTIIAPAYNEQGKIAKTIASLKKITYPNVEFIIVNDGSKDKTSEEAIASIAGDKRFRFIDRKQNKGKAASLNEGIAAARGEIIACMDADSMVDPQVFEKTLPYFHEDKSVGAVTISVRVYKPKKLLHKMIDIEYTIGLSLFLKVFSSFNGVFVTPGPFSLYRKKVLDEIGGFDTKNIVEDYEIAFRIHKSGYRIENCMDAYVVTICPPKFKQIYVQRRRWYSGSIDTALYHRKMLFNKRYGAFGMFVPFNFILLALGLLLFILAQFVSITHVIQNLAEYQYTGFNFFSHFTWNFDPYALSMVSVVATLSFIASIIFMFIALKMTRVDMKNKKVGMLMYPFMFLIYQVFWFGAIAAVVRRKKVVWR